LDAIDGNNIWNFDGDAVVRWNHTCSVYANYLVVGVASSNDITGVTYDDVDMTELIQIQNPGTQLFTSLWGLASPNNGVNEVEVTCDAYTMWIAGGSISLENVGAYIGSDTDTDDAESDSECTIAVTENSWVIDCMFCTTAPATTMGAGQVEYFVCGGGYFKGSYLADCPDGNATVSHSKATTGSWSHCAIALEPD
jgi:hypothetical protein